MSYPQQPGWNVQYPAPQYGSTPHQAEQGGDSGAPKYTMNFNEQSIRAAFIRKVFILVAVMTVSIGFLNMEITAYNNFSIVLMCFMITAVACGGVSLFATVTDRDLTSCTGIMCIATFCLAITLYVVYATIGAFLFLIWLAIDIQMIMGGRKYELSPEEYIFAVLALFMDIVQIFWLILMIFGGDRR
uniref:Uncharacterized protein n=1 Tax=Meloidogyne javanica TaxID=6303 RepID=A0A915LLL3_MELJA